MLLADALHEVVAANERLVLRRIALQAGLLALCGVGLARLEGPWWWGALVLFFLLLLGAAQLTSFFVHWGRTPLDGPFKALVLGAPRRREQVVELHAPDGTVHHLPVPLALVGPVCAAAARDGVPVVRDEAGAAALRAASKQTEALARMEALLPHVPTPELREAIAAALHEVKTRGLGHAALDAPLHELEVHLMAEHSAQTTRSLRGPRPVFAAELRADLSKLLQPLSPSPPSGGEGRGEGKSPL